MLTYFKRYEIFACVLAVAVLVDRQAHPAADLLALARLRTRLLERAYLENVRVVPALAQR